MLINANGQLSLLRVHDVGTKYGPPDDQIDVEVVVQFAGRADAYGFKLRSNSDEPSRTGMLGLLRDGFNNGWHVWIDYDALPEKHNFMLIRVWLTKPPA